MQTSLQLGRPRLQAGRKPGRWEGERGSGDPTDRNTVAVAEVGQEGLPPQPADLGLQDLPLPLPFRPQPAVAVGTVRGLRWSSEAR